MHFVLNDVLLSDLSGSDFREISYVQGLLNLSQSTQKCSSLLATGNTLP